MLRVKISDSHDILWNQNVENCIDLILHKEVEVKAKQFKKINTGIRVIIPEEVVGIPFFKNNLISKDRRNGIILYHPEGSFKLNNHSTEISIAVKNKTAQDMILNGYLCSIRFITVQFFELMSRHDNSDKGLSSARVKIELSKYE